MGSLTQLRAHGDLSSSVEVWADGAQVVIRDIDPANGLTTDSIRLTKSEARALMKALHSIING
jgi:hypothetical protein